jgi:hypothetical protein
MTLQLRVILSLIITSKNLFGMPTGLSISRSAPVSDTFLTAQSILAPRSKDIVPDLSTRRRADLGR